MASSKAHPHLPHRKKTVLPLTLVLLIIASVSATVPTPRALANTPSDRLLSLPALPLTTPPVFDFPLATPVASPLVSDDFQVTSDPNSLPQDEPSIAINPLNASNVVAGANDYRLVALGHDAWAGVYTSLDGGRSWDNSLIPGYPGSTITNALSGFGVGSDPALSFDAQGNLYYAGIVFNRVGNSAADGSVFVSKSTDGGFTFLQTVIVARGSGSSLFFDKPYIAVDSSSGTVYVSWTKFTTHGRTSASVIQVSKSTNGGLAWSTPITVSDTSNTQGSVPAAAKGRVYVTWLDGATNTIKIARSDNSGSSFLSSTVVSSVVQIPSPLPNGKFRDNSFPTVGVDPANPDRVTVAWADYRSGNADILDRSSTDGAVTWTSPLRVNDDTTTNDQFFPWLAVDQGLIHIIFYDRREDPADHNLDVFYSLSKDWGISFLTNQKLTDVPSDPNVDFNGQFIGDYIGLAASSGHVHAVWTDTRNSNQDIFTEERLTIRKIDLSVTPSRSVAYTGVPVHPVAINIQVFNQGNLTESIAVTGYANATAFDTKTVSTLGPGQNTTLLMSWNTTSISLGSYNITARAALLPSGSGLADSVGLGGIVVVRRAGDVNGDGVVDLNDLIALFTHEFTSNTVYDINNDGAVDLTDLIIAWQHEFT